jgi:DNA-directed RNA polymerase III subunit RPC6
MSLHMGGHAGAAGGGGGIVKYKVAKEFEPPDFLTQTPCGLCPAIAQCREGGVISPTSCLYMNDWPALNYDPTEPDGLSW